VSSSLRDGLFRAITFRRFCYAIDNDWMTFQSNAALQLVTLSGTGVIWDQVDNLTLPADSICAGSN
jgi:hypothetical protein